MVGCVCCSPILTCCTQMCLPWPYLNVLHSIPLCIKIQDYEMALRLRTCCRGCKPVAQGCLQQRESSGIATHARLQLSTQGCKQLSMHGCKQLSTQGCKQLSTRGCLQMSAEQLSCPTGGGNDTCPALGTCTPIQAYTHIGTCMCANTQQANMQGSTQKRTPQLRRHSIFGRFCPSSGKSTRGDKSAMLSVVSAQLHPTRQHTYLIAWLRMGGEIKHRQLRSRRWISAAALAERMGHLLHNAICVQGQEEGSRDQKERCVSQRAPSMACEIVP